ncbi:hypothetical protein Pcinc_043207 [Petrolisthes cinctipes]|uniref:Uncharacterized protein n=1 Tax=Petrolisthes cinctipes TaxID=88211 RepID=A0AAE1EI40_PETCI|nr:hypothetical protein Pcinc_043207 [Petrolisthes cinctipes]
MLEMQSVECVILEFVYLISVEVKALEMRQVFVLIRGKRRESIIPQVKRLQQAHDPVRQGLDPGESARRAPQRPEPGQVTAAPPGPVRVSGCHSNPRYASG